MRADPVDRRRPRSSGPGALVALALVALAVAVSCSGFTEEADVGDPAPSGAQADAARAERRARLAEVESWVYVLDVDLVDDTIAALVDSDHDLVVLDFIPSEVDNVDFPMGEVVDRLHGADHPKIVLAYLDVGQAEDYRTYWEDGWGVGDPDWIVGLDPDGWEGNLPVRYWDEDWQDIWLGDQGTIASVLDAGFDGVYLDWLEAYTDDNVVAAAEEDGVDPRVEMTMWVQALAATGRAGSPGFLVLAQNAAALALESTAYRQAIDGVAQEQVWFDGAADNRPPGDCPLPATEAEVEAEDYVESLVPGCRRQYEADPDSTLHVSSESYLDVLTELVGLGLPVFTVDYAEDEANVAFVLETSRAFGFRPFVGTRFLDAFVAPR